MARYTNESRDRVRDAVDFVELVSARTDLRRSGQNSYEGLCPFHEERTPSFGIDPVQKVYYCFGCQAGGDLFTFVQETESVDFTGALELLSDRYGVELEREREDPREAENRRRRERLLELIGRTSAYYERCLWESDEGAHAREYLAGRGLGEEILREFHVGYAPSAWDRVLSVSLRSGFSEAELYEAGLVQRSQQARGRVYDRFRGRIMFPLADTRGRVLGFGARVLELGRGQAAEAGDGQGSGGNGDGNGDGIAGGGGTAGGGERERRPKYLNTADNSIYHKGRHLYGTHLARAHAARAGRVILCEGYTDVIALHQAGIRNTVGSMGTALTAEQVGELGRMASTVLLMLDADSAGQEAMLRAAAVAARRKLELRVVPLPAGADPAEIMQREGGEAIERAIEAAVPFVRFRVQRVLDAGDRSSAEGRDRMLDELRPVFATIPPSALRMELVRTVSERLDLPESLAERALAARVARASSSGGREFSPGGSGRGGGSPARAGIGVQTGAPGVSTATGMSTATGATGAAATASYSTTNSTTGVAARGESTERALLAQCIADPLEGARTLSELDPEAHFTSAVLRRAVAHLREHLDNPGAGLPTDDPELAAAIAELIVQAGREVPAPAMLESQRMQLELARIDREIVRARGRESGDVNELARRRAEVKREFDRAYERALQETG
jgi:DNA primase